MSWAAFFWVLGSASVLFSLFLLYDDYLAGAAVCLVFAATFIGLAVGA